MSTLNLLHSMVAYNDTTGGTINNNPKFRVGDWNRQYFGLDVENCQSQNLVLGPNASITLYDGSRTTAIDGTTTFSITNTTGSTYRVYHSTGTAPGFRTARSLSSSLTTTFNVSVNNNSVVSISQSGGPAVTFGSVQVGDILYISSDSLFNAGNQGYFPVIAKGANYIQIQNASAVAESNISLSTNFASNFQIYSSSGVQVGDTAALSQGFSPVTLGNYEVTAVAPDFFEFISSDPLPLETSITTTATGLNFYNSAKFITYIETDQKCYIRFDSESTDVATIEPFAADNGVMSMFIKTGYNYRAILTNRSSITNCNVYLFTCEK
jgi:hypothetical protein